MKKNSNYNLIFGTAMTALLAALIITGFFWTPFDPNAQNALLKLQAPSLTHLLGTDNLGRDLLSRVITGAGTTLFIAAATVLISAFIGIITGALTGYFGGWLDELIMRINDTILAFPSILLALVLISLFGPGKYNVILALALLFIPSFSRIVRGEFRRLRELDYVKNARLMKASHLRVMLVHILPNAAPVLLSSIAIGFNNAVLAEAGMSYLGLGVRPPDASLGRMLAESQLYLTTAPWYAFSTGFAVVLLILSFSLLGEGISQIGNPAPLYIRRRRKSDRLAPPKHT